MISSFFSAVDSFLTLDEGCVRTDLLSGDSATIEGTLVSGRIAGVAGVISVVDVTSKIKKFFIISGKHKIELLPEMNLSPKPQSIIQHNRMIRLTKLNSRYCEIKLRDRRTFENWLYVLAESLAEIICMDALKQQESSNMSVCHSLKQCLTTCKLLTSPSKVFMQRVQNIYDIRRKLSEVMSTLRINPYDVNAKDIRILKESCRTYPELLADPDMNFLMERMSTERFKEADLQVILKDIMVAVEEPNSLSVECVGSDNANETSPLPAAVSSSPLDRSKNSNPNSAARSIKLRTKFTSPKQRMHLDDKVKSRTPKDTSIRLGVEFTTELNAKSELRDETDVESNPLITIHPVEKEFQLPEEREHICDNKSKDKPENFDQITTHQGDETESESVFENLTHHSSEDGGLDLFVDSSSILEGVEIENDSHQNGSKSATVLNDAEHALFSNSSEGKYFNGVKNTVGLNIQMVGYDTEEEMVDNIDNEVTDVSPSISYPSISTPPNKPDENRISLECIDLIPSTKSLLNKTSPKNEVAKIDLALSTYGKENIVNHTLVVVNGQLDQNAQRSFSPHQSVFSSVRSHSTTPRSRSNSTLRSPAARNYSSLVLTPRRQSLSKITRSSTQPPMKFSLSSTPYESRSASRRPSPTVSSRKTSLCHISNGEVASVFRKPIIESMPGPLSPKLKKRADEVLFPLQDENKDQANIDVSLTHDVVLVEEEAVGNAREIAATALQSQTCSKVETLVERELPVLQESKESASPAKLSDIFTVNFESSVVDTKEHVHHGDVSSSCIKPAVEERSGGALPSVEIPILCQQSPEQSVRNVELTDLEQVSNISSKSSKSHSLIMMKFIWRCSLAVVLLLVVATARYNAAPTVVSQQSSQTIESGPSAGSTLQDQTWATSYTTSTRSASVGVDVSQTGNVQLHVQFHPAIPEFAALPHPALHQKSGTVSQTQHYAKTRTSRVLQARFSRLKRILFLPIQLARAVFTKLTQSFAYYRRLFNEAE